VTALLGALAVLGAAFIKGAVGFGFPTLATPLLALLVDVKVAVAVLVLPNLVMDSLQASRRGRVTATGRRLGVLLAAGVLGMIAGTYALSRLPSRAVTLILGVFVLLFVVLNATRLAPRVRPGWERWLSLPVGLIAGVLGGITNVPSPPLIIYFYALGMDKHEFVRSVAVCFMVFKLVQLGALAGWGLLSWPIVGTSIALTAAGLGGFTLGLRVQDRLDQATFNRAILLFLGALGTWLVLRATL
jgi:uncharacterized membrane protein YfcA